jgi:hypothetical protein
MSQRPVIADLQRRLYEQLTDEVSMPTKSATSIERQAEALKQVASGKTVLVVLDGKLALIYDFQLLIICVFI